jgi:hypothetical protein
MLKAITASGTLFVELCQETRNSATGRRTSKHCNLGGATGVAFSLSIRQSCHAAAEVELKYYRRIIRP